MKKFILLMALVAVIGSGCATAKENPNTAKGAGIGGASGAVLGGAIGGRAGRTKEGVLMGGTVGAAIGGYLGRRMDQQAKELEQIAETKRTDEGLVSQLKGDILFDTDRAEVRPEARQNLVKMAEIMKKYPENVLTIKGFTDSTGPASYNKELSEERAESVRQVLVASGLADVPVTTVGLGEAAPVAANDTAQGRQQNRRVEIEITVDESKVPSSEN